MRRQRPARGLAVLVRGIDDAGDGLDAAVRLGVAVTLVSPPAAAESLGIGWWAALLRRLGAEHPGVSFAALLDCGARADLVQAALRQGLGRDARTGLLFSGPPATARRLGEIAAAQAATLSRRRPEALDLAGQSDRQAALGAWLSKSGPFRGAG